MHSSSGIPDTPGQKGEQGVKAERSGGGAWGAEGAEGLALLTGRPAVTGDCRLPGVTGRIDTPAIILQILTKYFNISNVYLRGGEAVCSCSGSESWEAARAGRTVRTERAVRAGQACVSPLEGGACCR